MFNTFTPHEKPIQNLEVQKLPTVKKRRWLRWGMPIGILVLVFVGIGVYVVYRQNRNTVSFSEYGNSGNCSEKDAVYADSMGSVSADTTQPSLFAYWDLYESSSSNVGYQERLRMYENDKNGPKSIIYTNAPQIYISIPYSIMNPEKDGTMYVEDLTLEAASGSLTSTAVVKQKLNIVFDTCNPDKFTIPLTYVLPASPTSTPIPLKVRYRIKDQSYERTYTVQPSVWTATALPNSTKLGMEYTVSANTDIPYQVTLKQPDGTPMTGKKITLADIETRVITTGTKQFTLSQQFQEVSPGVYLGAIRTSEVGRFAVMPSIEGAYPNPQYSLLSVTVTNTKPVSVLPVPSDITFSTMPYYKDANGEYMYFVYKKTMSTIEYGGYALKKVYLQDLSPTTLNGIAPLKNNGFRDFLVTPDEKTLVWGDNNDIRIFNINSDGTLTGPKYHDPYIEVYASGGVTTDSQRIVYTKANELLVFDIEAKKITSTIPEPGRVEKFIGSIDDAFYFISGRGINNDATEVVYFNGKTNAVEKRVNLLQSGIFYADAVLLTGETPQAVIAYQSKNLKEMRSGNCTYYKQLTPQDVTFGFLPVENMNEIRLKTVQLDLGDFDNMTIVSILPSDEGMYLEVELSKQNSDCNFSSRETYVYPLTKEGVPNGPRIALPETTRNALYSDGRIIAFQADPFNKSIRFYSLR